MVEQLVEQLWLDKLGADGQWQELAQALTTLGNTPPPFLWRVFRT